jgi:hypothetical protein
MSFTGNEDQQISLSTAAEMTKRYRDSVAAGTVLGHYIAKGILESILAQGGCVGIRAYRAIDENGSPTLVVTGVDANEDDLYNGTLADKTFSCPPRCGVDNPLNTDGS